MPPGLANRAPRWFPAFRKISGFSISPLLSIVSVLIVIPSIITVGGPRGWAAVAIAQGIGAATALIVMGGWGVVGPTKVAQTSTIEQPNLYWLSSVTRGMIFLVAVPVAMLVCAEARCSRFPLPLCLLLDRRSSGWLSNARLFGRQGCRLVRFDA